VSLVIGTILNCLCLQSIPITKMAGLVKYIVAITTHLHKMTIAAAPPPPPPQYPCKKMMLHLIAICALRLHVKALPNYEVVAA
jgi:hypothetical protein